MNITRGLFSRGTHLKFSSMSQSLEMCKSSPLKISEELPEPVKNSLFYPELYHFYSSLQNLKLNQNITDFEILTQPLNLKQKIMVRSLLKHSQSYIDESENVELKSISRFFDSNFMEKFQKDLLNEKDYAHAEIINFIQNIRNELDLLDKEFENKSKREELKILYIQFLMNICIFISLFALTYKVYDWEVVEPISYLLVVASNTILLFLMLRFRKKSGSNFGLISKNLRKDFDLRKSPLSFQKESFSRFEYEYSELIKQFH